MAIFGQYETVDLLRRTGSETVSSARLAAEKDARFVVHVFFPPVHLLDAVDRAAAVRDYLDRVAVEEQVAATAAATPPSHWPKVLESGETPDGGAYYISDAPQYALERFTKARREVNSDELAHIVRGIVGGLKQLQQACGQRSHGNLTLQTVLVGDLREPAESRVALIDPLPPRLLPRRHDEDLDARQIGALIFELIEQREFDAARHWPIQPSPPWNPLGKQAATWIALCNQLIDPNTPPPTLDQIEAALPKPAPKSKVNWVRIGIAAAALVLVAGVAWWIASILTTAPIEERAAIAWKQWMQTVAAGDIAYKRYDEWKHDAYLDREISPLLRSIRAELSIPDAAPELRDLTQPASELIDKPPTNLGWERIFEIAEDRHERSLELRKAMLEKLQGWETLATAQYRLDWLTQRGWTARAAPLHVLINEVRNEDPSRMLPAVVDLAQWQAREKQYVAIAAASDALTAIAQDLHTPQDPVLRHVSPLYDAISRTASAAAGTEADLRELQTNLATLLTLLQRVKAARDAHLKQVDYDYLKQDKPTPPAIAQGLALTNVTPADVSLLDEWIKLISAPTYRKLPAPAPQQAWPQPLKRISDGLAILKPRYPQAAALEAQLQNVLAARPLPWIGKFESDVKKADEACKALDKDVTRLVTPPADKDPRIASLAKIDSLEVLLRTVKAADKQDERRAIEKTLTDCRVRIGKLPKEWINAYADDIIKEAASIDPLLRDSSTAANRIADPRNPDWASRLVMIEKELRSPMLAADDQAGLQQFLQTHAALAARQQVLAGLPWLDESKQQLIRDDSKKLEDALASLEKTALDFLDGPPAVADPRDEIDKLIADARKRDPKLSAAEAVQVEDTAKKLATLRQQFPWRRRHRVAIEDAVKPQRVLLAGLLDPVDAVLARIALLEVTKDEVLKGDWDSRRGQIIDSTKKLNAKLPAAAGPERTKAKNALADTAWAVTDRVAEAFRQIDAKVICLGGQVKEPQKFPPVKAVPQSWNRTEGQSLFDERRATLTRDALKLMQLRRADPAAADQPAEPSLDGYTFAPPRSGWTEWSTQADAFVAECKLLPVLLADFARLEQLFSEQYAADEKPAGEDTRTIEAIAAAWFGDGDAAKSAAPVRDLYAPSLNKINDRGTLIDRGTYIHQLRSDPLKRGDRSLQAGLAAGNAPDESGFTTNHGTLAVTAWQQLATLTGNRRWPLTITELKSDNAMRKLLEARLKDTNLSDARQTYLRGQISEPQPVWVAVMNSLTGEAATDDAYHSGLELAAAYHVALVPANVAAADGLASFGEAAAKVTGLAAHARFNLLQFQLRRMVEAIGDKPEELRPRAAAFVKAARSAATDQALRDKLDDLEKQLNIKDSEARTDWAQIGPAKAGWTAEPAEDDSSVRFKPPAGKGIAEELLFLRIGQTSTYLQQTEMSLGLFIDVTHEWGGGTPPPAMKAFFSDAGADRQGAGWSMSNTAKLRRAATWRVIEAAWRDSPAAAAIRRERVGDASPMQRVSPAEALMVARRLHSRLPTSAEWQAAVDQQGTQPKVNRRDLSWKRFHDLLSDPGMTLQPWTDAYTYAEKSTRAEFVLEGKARDAKPVDAGSDDGFIWFAPVNDKDFSPAGSAPAGVNRWHHLLGNVAELVFDDAEQSAAAGVASADDAWKFFRDNESKLGVIGGSALSPAAMEPTRLFKLEREDPQFRENLRRYGASDVGFRLAFTANVSQKLVDRLKRWSQKVGYVAGK